MISPEITSRKVSERNSCSLCLLVFLRPDEGVAQKWITNVRSCECPSPSVSDESPLYPHTFLFSLYHGGHLPQSCSLGTCIVVIQLQLIVSILNHIKFPEVLRVIRQVNPQPRHLTAGVTAPAGEKPFKQLETKSEKSIKARSLAARRATRGNLKPGVCASVCACKN